MTDRNPASRNRAAWNARSDDYQAEHREQLSRIPMAWGVWAIPESELDVLGDVAGLDILEFGCGAAQWSIALANRDARVIGIDLSERQLLHARQSVSETQANLGLVHASAEHTPFKDQSFDIVFCDHGATTYAPPQRTVAEASRLLRPGGRFAFNIASPWLEVCWNDATDKVDRRLMKDYFDLNEIEDDGETAYQLPYGEWIRLFRHHSLIVEDLIEIRPPENARSSYAEFAPLEWARRWPAENLWILSKAK